MEVQKIIRSGEIRTVTGYGIAMIYRMIERGEFPKPVRLGRRAVGWRENDIAEWQSRLSAVSGDTIGRRLVKIRKTSTERSVRKRNRTN